jgi:hypothetical protein
MHKQQKQKQQLGPQATYSASQDSSKTMQLQKTFFSGGT